jgi:hypothetical protein
MDLGEYPMHSQTCVFWQLWKTIRYVSCAKRSGAAGRRGKVSFSTAWSRNLSCGISLFSATRSRPIISSSSSLCLLHRCRIPQELHYTHIMSCSIELGDHKQKYRKRLAGNPFFFSRKLVVPQQLIVQKIAIDLRYT